MIVSTTYGTRPLAATQPAQVAWWGILNHHCICTSLKNSHHWHSGYKVGLQQICRLLYKPTHPVVDTVDYCKKDVYNDHSYFWTLEDISRGGVMKAAFGALSVFINAIQGAWTVPLFSKANYPLRSQFFFAVNSRFYCSQFPDCLDIPRARDPQILVSLNCLTGIKVIAKGVSFSFFRFKSTSCYAYATQSSFQGFVPSHECQLSSHLYSAPPASLALTCTVLALRNMKLTTHSVRGLNLHNHVRHQNSTIKCSTHTFTLMNWVPAFGRALYDVVYVQAPVQNLEAELGLIALECGCHIHHCLRYRSHAEIRSKQVSRSP